MKGSDLLLVQLPHRYLFLSHLAPLPSVSSPLQVKFEIPYFTVSGIQVRYLKILEKSGYEALPWVRYISANGPQCEFRLA